MGEGTESVSESSTLPACDDVLVAFYLSAGPIIRSFSSLVSFRVRGPSVPDLPTTLVRPRRDQSIRNRSDHSVPRPTSQALSIVHRPSSDRVQRKLLC